VIRRGSLTTTGTFFNRCGLFAAAPELQAPFGVFARGIVMPMVHALGWDPRPSDGHLTRKLRGELISVLPSLCRSDAVVLAEARRRYDAL
jgi:hypothetical protein